MSKSKSFIKSALILSAGGIITKIMGAVCRIPLTNLLGSQGMGLYYLVFPLYTLLLAVSSAGIPVALSRLIAERMRINDLNGADRIFKTAFWTMTAIGAFFSLLLYLGAEKIALMQGNIEVAEGYRMISPAVLFVAQLSALRGYFQGKMSMAPTALSQIAEQVIKIIFTMTIAISFLPNIIKAVSYSVLAVSISEFFAVAMLGVFYYIERKKQKNIIRNNDIKPISKYMSAVLIFGAAVPITIGSIVFPLSQIIDSVLVIKIIGGYIGSGAISLYGLLTGPVNSLIGLPVILATGIAVAVVPVVSADRISGNREETKQKIEFALKLTFLIGITGAMGLLMFADKIISMLYVRLSGEELETAVLLLKISSISVLFISLMQTAVSILAALKKAVITTINLIIAVVLKIAFSIVLMRIPSINIYGSAISAVICYFAAALLNLFYLFKHTKISINSISVVIKPLICSVTAVFVAMGIFEIFVLFFSEYVAILAALLSALAVFVVVVIKTDLFTDYEINLIPLIKKFKNQSALK